MKKSLGFGRIFKMTQGDTIVEVMIAMAVLAVVVGAAYAMSARSYQSGINAQYRDQAVSYAQQQLELIKEADNGRPSTIASYTSSPGTPFCINPSNKTKQDVSSGNCLINSQYTESVVYDNSTKTFKATTSWTSADNHPQQSTLYYRANNSFAGNTVACTSDSPSCVSTITNPPSVSVIPAQNIIGPGTQDNISWAAMDIKPGSCTASGPGAFAASVNSNADPGSYPFSSAIAGSYTFSISCKDNAGHTVSKAATVNVAMPPSESSLSVSGLSTSTATLKGYVNNNGWALTYCRFWYGTTPYYDGNTVPSHGSAANCSPLTGGSVNAYISGLSANTTYYYKLCAQNPGGTTCANGSAFTTLQPANAQMSGMSYYITDNGNLVLSGYVNDYGIGGTTAWFEQSCYGGWNGSDPCNYLGAFPTASQGIGANYSNNYISAHIYPWTFYYYGYHDPYYFRICAQNLAGTVCSGAWALYN